LFKDRISAINSIVGAVKDKIANNYWNKLNEATISELGKKITKDQEAEKINIFKSDPPDEIYPQNLEEVSGQFVDYTAGKLIGAALPAIAHKYGTTPNEVMIPTIDKQKLLDYAMSGGQMDFENILKVMKERPSFLGEYSDLEKTALSGAMGRDVMGELDTGIKRASNILDYFAEPKKEKTWEQTLTEANEFIKNNPDYEISAMNPKTGSLSITKKTVKPEINWDELSEQVEKFGLKLTGMNVNPATGNVSYSFAGQGITWEETLGKANQFMKDNPDYEVTSTNPKTGSVTIEKKGKGTTDKVTPTEINLVEKQFSNIKTNEQYERALATVRQTDKNVKVPTKEEVFIGNYNKAIEAIKAFIDNTGKIKEGDYKPGYSYTDVYKALYEDLETAIQEFQIATGQSLDNPFVSFEEYEKSDVKKGKGLFYPSTWGQQKSVFKNIQTTEQIFGGTK